MFMNDLSKGKKTTQAWKNEAQRIEIIVGFSFGKITEHFSKEKKPLTKVDFKVLQIPTEFNWQKCYTSN